MILRLLRFFAAKERAAKVRTSAAPRGSLLAAGGAILAAALGAGLGAFAAGAVAVFAGVLMAVRRAAGETERGQGQQPGEEQCFHVFVFLIAGG